MRLVVGWGLVASERNGLFMSATTSRVDSGVVFRNGRGAEIRGALARLTRDALMFEVYSPYPVVETGETLQGLRVMRSGQPVCTGGSVVVDSVLSTGWNSMIVATPVGGWTQVEPSAPRGPLFGEADELIRSWENSHALLPDYQVAVANIRSFLSHFGRWMAQLDVSAGARPGDIEDVYAAVGPRLRGLFDALEGATARRPIESATAHRQYVQQELHPLMLCAPFVHRAYTKPMGYPGDYETVNMILRNRLEGPSAYAAILHLFVLSADTGNGHRNRIDLLTDHLESEAARVAPLGRPVRVLNLGCGPADEVVRFIRRSELAERCEFTLVDFNQETLDYASAQVREASAASGRRPAVTFVHRSVNDLIKEAARGKTAAAGPGYDLVYCAGLFDYLSDRICQKLLQLFNTWALPGGLVVATNVHPGHRSHAMMEDVLDWHLILRDEPQMLALAPEHEGTNKVFTEAAGVNVFLEMRKPGYRDGENRSS